MAVQAGVPWGTSLAQSAAKGYIEKYWRGGAGRGEEVSVHTETLKRAAEICGGEQALAARLKVTPSHLALWLKGIVTPPSDVFLRAVDIVTDQKIGSLPATKPAVPKE